MFLFYPVYPLGHPENCLFSLLRMIFIDATNPKKNLFNFQNKIIGIDHFEAKYAIEKVRLDHKLLKKVTVADARSKHHVQGDLCMYVFSQDAVVNEHRAFTGEGRQQQFPSRCV